MKICIRCWGKLYLCGVKLIGYIGIVLMAVMVGCTPPGPLSEGEGLPHTTSPRPSPGGEGGESPAAARHPLKRGTDSPAELPKLSGSVLKRVIDSPALTGTPSWRGNEDSIREYFERMELWEALHEGMSEMEGFK